jgi:hypothetical protein
MAGEELYMIGKYIEYDSGCEPEAFEVENINKIAVIVRAINNLK